MAASASGSAFHSTWMVTLQSMGTEGTAQVTAPCPGIMKTLCAVKVAGTSRTSRAILQLDHPG